MKVDVRSFLFVAVLAMPAYANENSDGESLAALESTHVVLACSDKKSSARIYFMATEGGFGVELALLNAGFDAERCMKIIVPLPVDVLTTCEARVQKLCGRVPYRYNHRTVYLVLPPRE